MHIMTPYFLFAHAELHYRSTVQVTRNIVLWYKRIYSNHKTVLFFQQKQQPQSSWETLEHLSIFFYIICISESISVNINAKDSANLLQTLSIDMNFLVSFYWAVLASDLTYLYRTWTLFVVLLHSNHLLFIKYTLRYCGLFWLLCMYFMMCIVHVFYSLTL